MQTVGSYIPGVPDNLAITLVRRLIPYLPYLTDDPTVPQRGVRLADMTIYQQKINTGLPSTIRKPGTIHIHDDRS